MQLIRIDLLTFSLTEPGPYLAFDAHVCYTVCNQISRARIFFTGLCIVITSEQVSTMRTQ